jgi:hypothetical protein
MQGLPLWQSTQGLKAARGTTDPKISLEFYLLNFYSSQYPRRSGSAIMFALTVIQRVLLPFPLRWKRKLSTSKTNERESKFFDDNSDHTDMNSDGCDIQTSSPDLECDDSNTVHLAVKSGLGTNTGLFPEIDNFQKIELDINSISDEESDLEDKSQSLPPCIDIDPSARSRLIRAVSWANIVRSQYRWTQEQEQQLKLAMKELARCQKAWSSEQELWLTQVRDISKFK